MGITNFSNIKIGEYFVVDGESYKKHDELIYIDGAGIQRYIDPLFDKRIGKKPETSKKDPNIIDVSAKIVKGDEEAEEAPKPKSKKSKKGA
jgi:hypothetical protein